MNAYSEFEAVLALIQDEVDIQPDMFMVCGDGACNATLLSQFFNSVPGDYHDDDRRK